jgi:thiol-disulfide isomerase/thioredoxin
MRRRTASLLVGAVFLLAGCRSGEKRVEDDRSSLGPDRPSDLTARAKDKAVNPDSPAHWLDRPKPDWMKGNTPAAPSWNSPKDPLYDYKAETNGLLTGYVEDPDGRKLKNVYIAVREVGDTNPKDIGVLSTADGAFVVQGLKPNRNYVLSVNMSEGERKLFGVVYTKTPNPNVRIALLEGDAGGTLPNNKPLTDKPFTDDPLKRPPVNSLPVPTAPNPNSGPLPDPALGAGNRGDRPTPRPLENDAGVYPTGGYEVPPSSGPLPERYDLMTDQGPLPWKPPAASIPTPRTGATVPSAESPRRSESRRADGNLLVDSRGQRVNLPQSKLVLLTFVTTASETCRRTVPTLNTLQSRYAGRSVEVVALVCDDEPLKTRVMAADQFRRDLDASFQVVTEPGKQAGDWLKRFGVVDIPTAVLLNSSGDVLWQGNPSRSADVVTVLEDHLRAMR